MITYYIPVLLGWLAGLIINYISDSLPYSRKLTKPICRICTTTQKPLNYFFWPRRCHKCGVRRRNRTWIVEITAIMFSVYLWNTQLAKPDFAAGLILLVYFGVVAVIDIEFRLILHPVSIAGAIIGLVIGVWLHGLRSTLIGGVAGFGIMFLLYQLGRLTMKLFSRICNQEYDEDALGFGDVNLSGVIGLILGWPGITIGLLLTILIAVAISLLYLLSKILLRQYKPNLALPYGPFLIASTIILLYFLPRA